METETVYDTTEGEISDWVLFSGGHDSLITTHICMEGTSPPNEFPEIHRDRKTEAVLHIDTRTGIQENQDFVIDVCEENGWPLRIEQSPITLKEYALEIASEEPFGFPTPRSHVIIYSYLKQEPLRTVATESDGKPHYWTGVRKHESDNRMANVTEAVEEVGQWYWHAPLKDWRDEDMDAYLSEFDLPRNPVVEVIHRSGECFCGAYSSRDEDLIDLQAHYPEHFEWIRDVEQEVIEELGEDNPRAYWTHGKLSDSDLAHLKSIRDVEEMVDDMMLCRDCRMMNQNSASDTDW